MPDPIGTDLTTQQNPAPPCCPGCSSLPPLTAQEREAMAAWWESPEAFRDTAEGDKAEGDTSPASAATDLF
jgi:hypothetical protein